MDPATFRIFTALFAVWGVAVAAKAAHALRSGQPYVFGIWDGGLIRSGKRLSRTGVKIKIGVGVAMTVGFVVLLASSGPSLNIAYAIGAVALVSIISDFVTEER